MCVYRKVQNVNAGAVHNKLEKKKRNSKIAKARIGNETTNWIKEDQKKKKKEDSNRKTSGKSERMCAKEKKKKEHTAVQH